MESALCLFQLLLNCSQCLCPLAFLSRAGSSGWGRCAGEMGKKRGEMCPDLPRKGKNLTMCDYLHLGTRNISLFTRLFSQSCLCKNLSLLPHPHYCVFRAECFLCTSVCNPPIQFINTHSSLQTP